MVSLFDFENREKIFPGIDSRIKFCLLTLTGAEHPAQEADFAFFLLRTEHLNDPERRFTLTPRDFALINPNTRTCPIFRFRRDAEITRAIYERVPVLIDESKGDEGNPWNVSFTTMFHMSNDSHLFRTREQLESDGWLLQGYEFGRDDRRYLPLYEGRLGHQYTHRFATQPKGELRELKPIEYHDPGYIIEPQYWVDEQTVIERLERRHHSCRTALLGHRRVARSTDERTVISAILPWGAASYGWILSLGPSAEQLLKLLAIYNSFAFDYSIRNKLSQPSIPQGTFEQVVAPTPASISLQDKKNQQSITSRAFELTYTAWDLLPFAQDMGYDGPPFQWDEERRFLLRCELDAAFFHLYGIERDDVDYIMDTFPIVKRKDEQRHGEFRTKHVILEIYEEMRRAIETGHPYTTRLDPPPADPRVAHSPSGLAVSN